MTNVTWSPPTLKRLLKLFFPYPHLSILRTLEYEHLEKLALKGKVLDYGGGSISNYSNSMDAWGAKDEFVQFESANIDPTTKPTYFISEDGPVAAPSNTYDCVIALNTFEHIFDLQMPLSEIRRLLKPGGSLIFIVPFIFRVHGHPDDYFRGTPSYWGKTLLAHGYSDIKIEVLCWGNYSLAAEIMPAKGFFKRILLYTGLVLDLIYSKIKFGNTSEVLDRQDHPSLNYARGYIISANMPK